MAEIVSNPTRVAAIAFTGMDLTDFVGPTEVFSHARNSSRERLCSLTVASDDEVSVTNQGVRILRDVDTAALIDQLETIDVLVIPGGAGFTADTIPSVPGLVKVLDAFIKLPPRPSGTPPRIVLSVCVGAFWLADAGILAGRVATTHYKLLDELKKVADRKAKGTTVVRQHYVDSGVDEERGLHIIMGGGITSGFDATLYLLENRFGADVANAAAAILDYSWRKEMTPFGFVS